MSTERKRADAAEGEDGEKSRRRLKVGPPASQKEPTITEEDELFDETIRHTVPPPAQENLG